MSSTRGRKWTPREERVLKQAAAQGESSYSPTLKRRLHRSPKAIYLHSLELGVPLPFKRPRWRSTPRPVRPPRRPLTQWTGDTAARSPCPHCGGRPLRVSGVFASCLYCGGTFPVSDASPEQERRFLINRDAGESRVSWGMRR